MVKKIIINVAILVLLIINVINIAQKGPSFLNIIAIIICGICLALNFVDRMRDD